MYFECCRCHNLVDDGCPSKHLCLDCLYVEEIADRADDYYASLCDARFGYPYIDDNIINKPAPIYDWDMPF